MFSTIISLALLGQGAPNLELHPVPTGGLRQAGYYIPQRLVLGETPTAGFKNVPAGAALYGSWSFGGKSYPTIEIQSAGKPVALTIDFSGKGDFAKATQFAWKGSRPLPDKPEAFQLYSLDLSAPGAIGGKTPLHVNFYRFDPTNAQRSAYKDVLLYYGDYALDGTATLGGKKFHVMIIDNSSSGIFTKPTAPAVTKLGNYTLLIDRDGDGKFRTNYEAYDTSKPFTIEGTTYEITNLTGNGLKTKIIKSDSIVAEVPIPPSLAVGKKVLAFTATDRSGKTVHFPEDFKGKIVMLDFWATWCGPCMGEVPNVVSVYNQMHDKGFEILGVSLDNAQTIDKIDPVTKDKGMTWDQIADGKYWDAAIAKLYGIQAIPAAYIVDGDTGLILNTGDKIRGNNLLPAVTKAVNDKHSNPH